MVTTVDYTLRVDLLITGLWPYTIGALESKEHTYNFLTSNPKPSQLGVLSCKFMNRVDSKEKNTELLVFMGFSKLSIISILISYYIAYNKFAFPFFIIFLR